MSTHFSPIELLEQQLRNRFSAASIQLDRPRKSSGIWFLDINVDDHPVIIQWQKDSQFGVSSSAEHAYGDGADELYPNEEATYGRVVSLLLSRAFTSPPESVRLGELRKERGLSQAEVAAMLNTQQGEISKIENRNDVRVSTLRKMVHSMGAALRITARFPDGIERSLDIGETSAADTPQRSVAGRSR